MADGRTLFRALRDVPEAGRVIVAFVISLLFISCRRRRGCRELIAIFRDKSGHLMTSFREKLVRCALIASWPHCCSSKRAAA
jgi:hypothetical protein